MFGDSDVRECGRRAAATTTTTRRPAGKSNDSNTFYELATPDGIHIRYYKIVAAEPGKVIIENALPGIQLSYTIHGTKCYRIRNGMQELICLKKQEYNYLFLAPEPIHLTWQAGEQIEMFELTINPDLMLYYLSEDHPLYGRLQQSLQQKKSMVMNDTSQLIKAKSNSILYDILYCPLEGRYKQLYIKSKVGELLALELGAYEKQMSITGSHTTRPLRLKQRDIEKMHLVKDIILSDFTKTYSLLDLAQQVGTNDSYLKRHFKEVFGTTVYGFIQDAKMENARKLLLEGHNVSGTAFMMGYKHAVHFTRAFKKYFSISPNQIAK
ncbi:AraC-type DNA-binding protein [Filimonas lacunae]|uniref:AraC-type DNA-binding protein n=1 Tax=Filimonas lacunae TaxID=477680 RepID=A0A173MCL7_9BACT|nr:AraC family transcriptional regulator [Filimonas lacunae]BAV05323.1 transcriptional regulator, AraC family [Filimonas lacunae]SIT21983.1 AraC-type DNA-binding protein [Filimonas lacunae]